MSALTLTLKTSPQQRIDMGSVTPDALADLSPEQFAALELWQGNRKYRLDELFDIDGDDRDQIVIRNSHRTLDRLGAEMTRGSLTVEGDVGDYAGQNMSGGLLQISGNSGSHAGAGLSGGRIEIGGDAGNCLGGAAPGDKLGMRGGLILVRGNAGDRVGDRLRRGMILIEGDTGNYCASRMVAGTIAVLGRTGSGMGLGMKRGTIILKQTPGGLPPTFSDDGDYQLSFLTLMLSSWHQLDSRFAGLDPARCTARRYTGDRGSAGLGEILVLN